MTPYKIILQFTPKKKKYPDFISSGKPLLIFVLTILFRSCTSPDFGVSGVLDRFQQINPKIVFSVDAVSYNMKIHDHFGKLRQVCNGIGDNLLK